MPNAKTISFNKNCSEGRRALEEFLGSTFQLRPEELLQGCVHYACIKRSSTIEAFCFSKEMLKLLDVLDKADMHPYSLGLFLGTLEGGNLKPSLQLGCEIAKNIGILSRSLTIVDENYVGRIIRGAPVPVKAIVKKLESPTGIYLIVNEKGYFLAWGIIKEGKLIPTLDVGWYLRMGR